MGYITNISLKKNMPSVIYDMLMTKGYTTVSIPDPLMKKVEDFIQANPGLGYRNRSEFIIEAIREKLLQSEKEKR